MGGETYLERASCVVWWVCPVISQQTNMSSCWSIKPLRFQPSSSSPFHSNNVRRTTTTLSLRSLCPPTTSLSHNLHFQPKLKRTSTTVRCSSALTPELKSTLDKVVTSNKVVLFMKGTKDFPQCGFSNTVVQILKSLNVPFETINILENEILRQGLKEYSSWPTFPQLYIDGEFFGGCDITVDAYQSGELQELLEKVMCF